MTTTTTNKDIVNNAGIDAFGRARVSNPTTLFDSQMQYNNGPLFWQSVGDGTATHAAASASVAMSVTAGQSLKRVTRAYHRYQPGKSQFILLTGVLGAATAGVTKRIGYFDDNNGIFFELTSTGFYIVQRSKVSGTVVNTAVEQAQWNVSGCDWVDVTKANIYAIDLEWLGVGRVRVGIVRDGVVEYAHVFNNENANTTVYMQTANLPLCYEIVSTTGAGSMSQICAAVNSEGGFTEEYGIPHSVAAGTVPVSCTTLRPVLSIQPVTTYAGQTNRGQIVPQSVSLMVTGNPAYYCVVFGGTVTGGSFGSVGANSIVAYDIAGTALTGGETIAAGYVATSSVAAGARATGASSLSSKLPLTVDYSGTVPTNLTVMAAGIGGAAGVYATIDWREVY